MMSPEIHFLLRYVNKPVARKRAHVPFSYMVGERVAGGVIVSREYDFADVRYPTYDILYEDGLVATVMQKRLGVALEMVA